MRLLGKEAIEDIATGAAVLGTGGGGDPYIGKLIAIQAIDRFGAVPLLTVDELDDHALVVSVAKIGAPTVGVEKILSMDELIATVDLMEETLGKQISAIMPIEIGGSNSMIPLAVAAYKQVPVVDADAMGRAFPELQMITFYLDGLPSSPVTMADALGNRIVLESVDHIWLERFARDLAIQMGGTATTCSDPLPGKQIKQSAIPGMITMAEEIGVILRKTIKTNENPVQAVIKYANGYTLFQGKSIYVHRETKGGFARGKVVFSGLDQDQGKEMELYFQNEFLVAIQQGKPKAMTPDLIAVLDTETGQPITTERLKYGLRATIVAFPCHTKWRTTKGIETVGPRYFGYDFDYVPLEKLMMKGEP